MQIASVPLLAALCLVVMSTNASSDVARCNGDGHGQISNDSVKFSFNSWVSQGGGSPQRGILGRCVMAEGRQNFSAEWWPAMLAGRVEFDHPLYAETPYFSDTYKEIYSVIYFSADNDTWRSTSTPLLVGNNEVLIDSPALAVAQPPDLADILNRAIERKLTPSEMEAFLNLPSSAEVGITLPVTNQPAFLRITVNSVIPRADGPYLYNGALEIKASADEASMNAILFHSELTRQVITIEPESPKLAFSLGMAKRRIALLNLLLSDDRGDIVQLPPMEREDFGIEATAFRITSNGETLARFPVVAYTATSAIDN